MHRKQSFDTLTLLLLLLLILTPLMTVPACQTRDHGRSGHLEESKQPPGDGALPWPPTLRPRTPGDQPGAGATNSGAGTTSAESHKTATPPSGTSGEIQAISLLGRPLRALTDSPRQAELLAALTVAREQLRATPDDPDAHIWLARRQGYLWRMNDAIDTLSRAIERWPDNPALYRHRGHRYLSVRRLAEARADLTLAAELCQGLPDQIEADGAPNERGVPLTTLKSNIFYHLGLAHYLLGDYAEAEAAFAECELHGRGLDDNRVSSGYWRYLSLRRMALLEDDKSISRNRLDSSAAILDGIHPGMVLLENRSYHMLLLYFKGLMSIDALVGPGPGTVDHATIGYGIGVYELLRGDAGAARREWERVCEGTAWPAFGFLAAEVELARLAGNRSKILRKVLD